MLLTHFDQNEVKNLSVCFYSYINVKGVILYIIYVWQGQRVIKILWLLCMVLKCPQLAVYSSYSDRWSKYLAWNR